MWRLCSKCCTFDQDSRKIQEKCCVGQYSGGIKKKLGGGWAVPPSPPEALNPKFDLIHIPIFYLFDGNGNCFGRIVENPTLAPPWKKNFFC